jgi:plastocyanin
VTTTHLETNTRNRAKQPTSWTWRRLLRAAALTSIAVSAFAVLAIGGGEAIVFAVVVGIGVFWLRRPGRGGVVYLGVVHLLVGLIVLVLFQLLAELAYPASWKVFVVTGGRLVATVTALIATVGALRGGPGSAAAPRTAAAIAGAALLAFSIVGIGAGLSVSDDKRQPGDVAIEITSDTQFGPRELKLAAGRIAVYVENHDVHHGSFTIDGVVSLDIPAGSAQRATFDLAPGRYRYYSKLYPEEVNGTMVVS